MAGAHGRQPHDRRGRKASGSQGTKFTILIAVIVLLYILPRLVSFMNTDKMNFVVARMGTMEKKSAVQGVITREEQLCKSVSDGVVEYYYPGKRELSRNTVVCTVRDDAYYGDILKQKQEDVSSEIASISNSEYADLFTEVETSIASQVRNFQQTRDENAYADVYNLKDALSSAVQNRQELYSLLSGSLASRLLEEQGVYEDLEKESSENLWISEAGIISYSYDGYEGWDSARIDEDFIDRYKGSYTHLNINLQPVHAGDPLYRLITSQKWDITAFLTEDQARLVNQDDSGVITFSCDGSKPLTGTIASLEESGKGRYKLVIAMNSRVQEYMDERIVTLSFEEERCEGLKIPDSCLVERAYYKIPSVCVFQNENREGVMQKTEQGSAFVEIDFAWNDEEFYYFELPDGLPAGTALCKAGSEETVTLQDQETAYGVYILNGGNSEFERVEILYQEDGYSIVEGIQPFDHIMLVNESE